MSVYRAEKSRFNDSWNIERQFPCINGLSAWFVVAVVHEADEAELGYTEGAFGTAEARARHIAGVLASGLVQDEAGEPTTAMIDAGVAFALSVSLSGEYRWSQYVADLYKTMRAAAIRSARDGGAET